MRRKRHKPKVRSKDPKTLGDLVGGDRAVISIHDQGGDKEVEIGFRIGEAIFVRVLQSDIDQPICFSETTPFSELTYEQPGGVGLPPMRTRDEWDTTEDHDDPLIRIERKNHE